MHQVVKLAAQHNSKGSNKLKSLLLSRYQSICFQVGVLPYYLPPFKIKIGNLI